MGLTFQNKCDLLKALYKVEGTEGFDSERIENLKRKLREETTKNDE